MLYYYVAFALLFFFSSRRRHTRCALVTGVQTCALPICRRASPTPVHPTIRLATQAPQARRSRALGSAAHAPLPPPAPAPLLPHLNASARWRSDERRVGKSVSVSVDLGGRRIIKKKNKHNAGDERQEKTRNRKRRN